MASCPCLYMEWLFVYNEYCAQRGVLLGYAFCFQRSFRKQQPSSPQTAIRVYISVSCVVFWYRGSSKAVECLEFLRCDPWWALFSFWVLILYEGLWKVCLMLCFYFLPRFSKCVLESHLLTSARNVSARGDKSQPLLLQVEEGGCFIVIISHTEEYTRIGSSP